jgi:two-component sensor histidine kinase/PAS domain-containing protein
MDAYLRLVGRAGVLDTGPLPWAIGILSALAAFGLRIAVAPVDAGIPYVTFFPAVMFAAFVAGARAAAAAVAVSVVVVAWQLLPDGRILGDRSWTLAFFAVAATACAVPIVMLRRAVAALEGGRRELRDSEARYRVLFSAMSEGFAVLDLEADGEAGAPDHGDRWRVAEANPAFARLAGTTAAAAAGRSLDELLPGATDEWRDRLGRVARSGAPTHFDGALDPPGGWFEVYAFRVAPGRVAVLLLDVSGRRRAEAALSLSEERFRLAARAVQGLVYDWDVETGSVVRSEGLRDLVGLDPADLPPTRDAWTERVHPDDLVRLLADGTAAPPRLGTDDASHFAAEYRVRHADGRWVTVWDQGLVLRAEDGRPRRVVGSTVDVTARRALEDDLQAALARQEILTREVHHRVKNSLQVVSSLLRIHSRQTRDEAVREAFADATARIQAVALAHQMLYRDGEVMHAAVGPFVRQLADQLQSLFREAGPRRVRVEMEGPGWRMPADDLVPFALVVNELATNALRHAYPPGEEGDVLIELRSGLDGGNRLQVRVEDRGRGLPAGFDPARSETLGMQLVTTLVRQLGGTLSAEDPPGGGSRFTVTLEMRGLRAAA